MKNEIGRLCDTNKSGRNKLFRIFYSIYNEPILYNSDIIFTKYT